VEKFDLHRVGELFTNAYEKQQKKQETKPTIAYMAYIGI
jgi:hypothetical protein